MTKESMQLAFEKAKPFLGVVFLQARLSGMYIISKAALNEGMGNFVFVIYCHAVATLIIAPFAFFLDKKIRPKMTISAFLEIRLEKVKMMSIRSLGTLATVAGAMIMTLVRGPNLDFPWTRGAISPAHQRSLLITIGCFGWAAFMILQAVTLRTYPASWICLLGTGEGAAVALAVEKGNIAAAWSIQWVDTRSRSLATDNSGIFCSGIAYYLQGVVMKERGPVQPSQHIWVVGAFVIVMGQAENLQFMEVEEIPIKQTKVSNSSKLDVRSSNGPNIEAVFFFDVPTLKLLIAD